MMDILKNYTEFMTLMDARLQEVGLNIQNYPLDHAGFRITNLEDYKLYLEYWKENSVIHTTKRFHGREFHMFMLKMPLVYKTSEVYAIEFTEPGGSDNYATGFQHIEILTPLSFQELFPNQEVIAPYYFAGRFDDEIYLKWEDKMVLKLRKKPITYMATAEDNPHIEVR